MIAAIGGFITLVVFIAIAIISSLLKRKEETQELPPELRPRGRRPQPAPSSSWEEELRRVLAETVLPAPPVAPRLPPLRPVVRKVPPPIPASEPDSDEGGIEVSLPAPPPFAAPVFTQLPGLVESQERYAGAAQLQERVAQHMSDVIRRPVGTTAAHHTLFPAETVEATRALRTRGGARAAIIASIILGPPRALEG